MIQQRLLGRQGLATSAVGLGCMGMSFAYTGGADEAECAATVLEAIDLGVTLLDTAEVYGPFENERLLARMSQFFDRIESQLRQSLRLAAESAGSATPTVDANVQASVLTAFCVGRLQRYARSGFKRLPTEQLESAQRMLLG